MVKLANRGVGLPGAPAVAVVVATKDRTDLLLGRCLPSIARQSTQPQTVVVVNDGAAWDPGTRTRLHRSVPGRPLVLLSNRRKPGPGGAWNTALSHLHSARHDGFVAFLDDDDSWDADHLAVNLARAREMGAGIVVSGLRAVRGSEVIDRPLVTTLRVDAFLVGNPGWQGSNTFVSSRLLRAVGGFREGLASCHDRDLAIRLLRHPESRWAVEPRWTATWYVGTEDSLSTAGSTAKREGLRAFFRLYGDAMAMAQREQFLARGWMLFRISPQEILASDAPAPTLSGPRGDFDA